MNETDALKRPFLLGVLAVVIVFVFLGGVIAAFGSNADRAEGVAERWLNAVSDTTRKGVRDDARDRVSETGPVALIDELVPPGIDTDGKTAFTELEVGRSMRLSNGRLVPFAVHRRDAEGDAGEIVGAIVMRRVDDEWKVIGLAERPLGAELPSEGGPPVSSAPVGVYVGAVLVGVLVTVAASILVRAAGGGGQFRRAG